MSSPLSRLHFFSSAGWRASPPPHLPRRGLRSSSGRRPAGFPPRPVLRGAPLLPPNALSLTSTPGPGKSTTPASTEPCLHLNTLAKTNSSLDGRHSVHPWQPDALMTTSHFAVRNILAATHHNPVPPWRSGRTVGKARTGEVLGCIDRNLRGLAQIPDDSTLRRRQFVFGLGVRDGHQDASWRARTPEPNTPSMDGKRVLMGTDVWEHAYYSITITPPRFTSMLGGIRLP